MLTTRIIACLDVAEGRVVKSLNFVNPIDVGDTGVIFGAISGRALYDGAIDLGAAIAALKI